MAEEERPMSQSKLWAGLILLFSSGLLTGIVATYLYGNVERSRPAEPGSAQHERIMKRLTEELSLTPGQQADIQPTVTRAHTAILELRLSNQAEVEEILARGMADLKPTLSKEQQHKLDLMYGRLQGRWQASRDHLEAMKKDLASR
jgi:hypothetical protein